MNPTEVELLDFEAKIFCRRPDVEPPGGVSVDLARHIRSAAALRDARPLPVDQYLPHLASIVEDAPYLLSARSSFVVSVGQPCHLRLRNAWRSAVPRHASSAMALCNACDFFLRWSEDEARASIEAALLIAPKDSLVLMQAGEFEFQGADLGWKGCSYDLALTYLERAMALSPIPNFITYIGQAAMAALEAGNDSRAKELAAKAMVAQVAPFDENSHLGYCVVGLLALREGRARDALVCLDASKIGSWWSWGPSLRLARELALAGHVVEVEAFLRTVVEWVGRRPEGTEECWIAALNAGNYDELKNPGR